MYNSDLPTRAELPSSKQLLRSTIIAILVATVLLVTVVLPSEYGIDPTGVGRVLGLTKMGEIKTALAAEAAKDRSAQASQPVVEPASTAPVRPAEVSMGTSKKDEVTITLKPGEGAEVKLQMVKGAKANYEWVSAGGPVNHDTHGDNPAGAKHSFSKGKEVERDAGELLAPFDGNHGWFWRNRTDGDVTVTLKVSGEYQSVKRVA